MRCRHSFFYSLSRRKMKIIHTSDWHIGQIFYEYDRDGEHLAFLERLREIIVSEKPDALLISGDIFDSAMPSAQSQRLYTDAILRLKSACPDMTVVVTAGNHDSGTRLETVRNLWDKSGVKVIGCLSRNGNMVRYGDHIIRIASASEPGRIAGYVVALPHIYRQNYPACTEEDRQAGFYRKIMSAVNEENTGKLPVVMMAHLSVSGSDMSGQGLVTGGMDYVPAGIFPEECDYVALGHIHKPQTVRQDCSRKKETGPVVRYSGSPIPLSFDEGYRHTVSIVEMTPGREADIREVEIPCSIPVLTIPGKPAPFEKALNALKNFPDDKQAYVRLNVMISDFLPPNASAQAVQAAGKKECRYCCMKIIRTAETENEKGNRLTVDEIKAINPLEVAEMYYRRRFGKDMDMEMKDMLSAVIRKVAEKEMKEE